MNYSNKRRLSSRPALFFIGLVFSLGLGLGTQIPVLLPGMPVWAQAASRSLALPQPQAHPLPLPLNQWQDAANQGDYFSKIQPTPVGYLVWSEFPIQIYVEPVSDSLGTNSQGWVAAVNQAIQEWNAYLPLELVSSPTSADITIWRSAPAIQGFDREAETGEESSRPRLPRIQSAETRYQIFVDYPPDTSAHLAHRFTIQLSPNQTIDYVRAAARHELGHALGIWGHSPMETDALYFSQVRSPATISDRDINTLKKIYEQPTLLGWDLVETEG